MPLQITPFGKYDLLERVNVGGMAEVWKARLSGVEGFEKILAVKRILPNIAEDDEFVSMFIDEAKIAVQLTHANIAQIHDLGRIDDSYFIAMEYVSGKDLRAVFDRARKRKQHIPVPLVCYCVARVCDALDYAHRKKDAQGRDLGIVHRDVSPQNVLLSYEGEVKLVDFGIAKAANKAQQTQAGILKGKFAYMSPEQVRGAPLDGRSDIFALGTVFYELLTGERLFPGDSDFSTLENVRNMKILPPSTYNNRIPGELEPVVFKALERDVGRRYRTAGEFGADLQRFLVTQETVFGPSDLSTYMRNTFSEEMGKEKVKAQELAAASALVARRTPAGMRSSGSFAAVRAGGSGARASNSGPGARTPPGARASISGPVGRGSPTPPGLRGSGSGPLGREGLGEPPPTVPNVARPPLPPALRPSPPAGVPRDPPMMMPTAIRPVVGESQPRAAAPRRTPPWLVSVVAGAAGAAVVAASAALYLAFRPPPQGVLVIRPTPREASITIDRVVHAQGATTLSLPAGPHDITVEAKGFAPFHQNVVVQSDEPRVVEAKLQAAP
ncbi:MAG TPA: protein kinase [Solirubrobacteraceae bacterium]|nr:protein kinase [Solirubrobacteraceae bacterium]